MQFKGDIGMFRQCLQDAGFKDASGRTIFNDHRKTGGRRLKLWSGSVVFLATEGEQQRLWNKMLEVFGDRILKVEFIDCSRWLFIQKSLVVHLKD
jgi:hypothetical protein